MPKLRTHRFKAGDAVMVSLWQYSTTSWLEGVVVEQLTNDDDSLAYKIKVDTFRKSGDIQYVTEDKRKLLSVDEYKARKQAIEDRVTARSTERSDARRDEMLRYRNNLATRIVQALFDTGLVPNGEISVNKKKMEQAIIPVLGAVYPPRWD